MRSTRGFTLLEMTLALALGSSVLIAAVGMFYSLDRTDRLSRSASVATSELFATQTVLRATFMNLLVSQGAAMDAENAPDLETLGRARVILEPDAAIDGQAQRLEVVLRRSPVPTALQGPSARRAFAEEDAASLNFATADGSGGSARCVFELRPDGERERVMHELGLDNPLADAPPQEDRGWSLWWRRMTADEVERLDAGLAPWPDGHGEPAAEIRRLSTAVRLATGLEEAAWKMFRRDVRETQFLVYTQGDLPAYAELELASVTGAYGNWLFEIGWAYGDEPDEEAADETPEDGPTGPRGDGPSVEPRNTNPRGVGPRTIQRVGGSGEP